MCYKEVLHVIKKEVLCYRSIACYKEVLHVLKKEVLCYRSIVL